MKTEQALIAACLALIGPYGVLSAPELALVQTVPTDVAATADDVSVLRHAITAGGDPLGDSFALIRSAADRRVSGAVYTPSLIVQSMMNWLVHQGAPARVVDPGAGSGRFILAAGQAFPDAELLAVEMDPLAALMLRANLAVCGFSARTTVIVGDYREINLPDCKGKTAFIGNPPYVRHHGISEHWKAWYAGHFANLGIKASGLAGLHLYFFLQTRLLAKAGDVGVFITSAEWLDVNYGSALRRLLIEELGGLALHVLEPKVEAFPGTATTAAITCFRVGEVTLPFRVRSVEMISQLNGLTKGSEVSRELLQSERRWSIIVKPSAPHNAGEIELGELFRVHRGQVTGGNSIWIAAEQAANLPDRVKIACVTKARDLIQAGGTLLSADYLRRVIDLPPDLDTFTQEERQPIDIFLAWARANGGDQSYTAQHRKAWWAVGLKAPAPILCTYMGRRPPQFTLNTCHARHINIAHGLYPRGALTQDELTHLVAWLNKNINTASGRTYAGGLTKFEPKEVERLRIPRIDTFTL